MKKSSSSKYINATEVAKLLGVNLHILYYWEKKIPQIKSKRVINRRFYSKEQVALLFKVKQLLEQGYSLSGIAKVLKEKKDIEKASTFEISEEKNLKKVLKEVLEELKDIYNKL